MPAPLLSTLLLLALATWWQQRQSQAEPVVSHCACGDLVQHVPGLPYRCPSCGGWAWSL